VAKVHFVFFFVAAIFFFLSLFLFIYLFFGSTSIGQTPNVKKKTHTLK